MLTGGAVAPCACSVHMPAGQSRRAARCVVSERAVYSSYSIMCAFLSSAYLAAQTRMRPPEETAAPIPAAVTFRLDFLLFRRFGALQVGDGHRLTWVFLHTSSLRSNNKNNDSRQLLVCRLHPDTGTRQRHKQANIRRERERVTRPIAHWKASRFSGVKVSQVKGISRDMTTTLGWQHVHFFLGTTGGSST